MMWKKDGKVIDKVLYPREQSLKSREFKVTYPSDGGVYSCDLISKLRGIKEYNVSGTVVITGKASVNIGFLSYRCIVEGSAIYVTTCHMLLFFTERGRIIIK